MEYKKSYKGLVIFFVCFIVAISGFAFLSGMYFYQHIARVSISVVNVALAALTFVIYKTQYIYWFNGISFNDAKEAGEERRKAYALSHFKLFGVYAALQLVFSTVMGFLSVTQWVDFAVAAVALCMVAIGTLKIKL